MRDSVEKHGRCLCGKIELHAQAVDVHVHACHCNMCQLWNGGPTFSVSCGTQVSFSNADNITVYRSCEWAELGFCKICGSHLFYRLVESGDYLLHPGSLESSDELILEEQVFVDEKPSWYSFANQTTNLTGAEVFARHQANRSKT